MTAKPSRKTRRTIEFGDFQSPAALAARVAAVVAARGTQPRSIVEPTCGRGSMLHAALQAFPRVERALGVDVCADHLAAAATRLECEGVGGRVELRHADFFSCDWPRVLASLADPVLVIGNPPWVTSSTLATLGSGNVPTKTNHHGRRGIDAVTGHANFDIAEWMVTHLLESCGTRRATIAMLVKTSVARKVLTRAWKTKQPIVEAALYHLDAWAFFGAAVDAGLLVVDLDVERPRDTRCRVHDLDRPGVCRQVVAYRAGTVVADDAAYMARRHLEQADEQADGQADDATGSFRWRSGIKHDCAKIMELRRTPSGLENGLGEVVDVEPEHVYPMLKGAAVARGADALGERFMIVTQTHTGADTAVLATTAPRTWAYLSRHGDRLDRRASVVYRGRPRFCMFGVGPYAFAPWKVAIGGLAKTLTFTVVGPHDGRPVVFDDTACAMSFETAAEACRVAQALNGEAARAFLSAFVFWDAKRPVTIGVLRRLSIPALLDHCRDHEACGIVETVGARGL